MQFLQHLCEHQESCCSIEVPFGWRYHFIQLFTSSISFLELKDPDSELVFLDYVAELRWRKAIDPRDKIYGLLGLGISGAANVVRVDYDLSVEEVYEAFVHSLLHHTKNLAVLTYVKPDHRQASVNLPSYVPDWSLPDREAMGLILADSMSLRCQLSHIYNAVGGTPAEIRAQPGILSIRGVIVDTVAFFAVRTLNGVQETGGLGHPWIEFFDEVQKMAGVPPPDHDTWPVKYKAFWIAMTAAISKGEEVSAPAPFDPQLCRRASNLDIKLHQDYDRFFQTNNEEITLDFSCRGNFAVSTESVGSHRTGAGS